MVHDPFDFFDSVLIDNLLFNDFNLFNGGNFDFDFDDLFNDSGYFNNLFDGLDKRDWLFNVNFNNFWNFLNVVDNFSSIDWFYGLNENIISSVNSNKLRNVDCLWDNFFNDNFNWNSFLDDLFHSDDFLDNNFDLLDFWDWDMNGFLNNSWFLDFNDFLDHNLMIFSTVFSTVTT